MDKIQEEITRWVKVHPESSFQFKGLTGCVVNMSFGSGETFDLIYQTDDYKPQMVVCNVDDPEIIDWVMVINLHLNVNSHRGTTDFLSRAATALPEKYKVTPVEEKIANGANSSPIEHEIKEEPMPMANTQQTGAERIRQEITNWKLENEYIVVDLVLLDEINKKASFTLGYAHHPFVISFDENWEVTKLESDVVELIESIVIINERLNVEGKEKETNEDQMELDDTKNSISVTEILTQLGINFYIANQNKVNTESKAHDILYRRSQQPNYFSSPTIPTPGEPQEIKVEPEYQEPTEEDWENEIIPGIRKYLSTDNFQYYEIEEYVGRINIKLKSGKSSAQQFIAKEVLNGSPIPEDIIRFFPKDMRRPTYRYGSWGDGFMGNYNNVRNASLDLEENYKYKEGTVAGAEKLKLELKNIKALGDPKDIGFSATPFEDDLYHWNVKLSGFEYDGLLGRDLQEYAFRVNPDYGTEESGMVKQAEIIIEIKFLPNYPESPPLFRLISPQLVTENGRSIFNFSSCDDDEDRMVQDGLDASTTTSTSTSTSTSSDVDKISVPSSKKKKLTISGQWEHATSKGSAWKPNGTSTSTSTSSSSPNSDRLSLSKSGGKKNGWDSSLTIEQIVRRIRDGIINTGARVDMRSAVKEYGLPTVKSFWRSFKAKSASNAGRKEIENGAKVILPSSVIEELLFQDELGRDSGSRWKISSGDTTSESPLVFELSGTEGIRLFCGVLEFTSHEGELVVPDWMMDTLAIAEASEVQLRRVKLQKGDSVKLQPHSAEFLKLGSPKATLEWTLPNFVALTEGSTIVVTENGKKYSINVLEISPPVKAISIIDTNLNLEFAPPLHGNIEWKEGDILSFGGDSTSTSTSTNPSSTFDDSNVSKPDDSSSVGTLDVSDMTEGTDYKICDNCRHPIGISSFMTHSIRCPRINWRCNQCGAVVPHNQKEEHLDNAHGPIECTLCGDVVEKRHLDQHKVEQCTHRNVQCEFCELHLPYVNKFQHEQKCGDITEVCTECKKRIRRRDLAAHPELCKKPVQYYGSSYDKFSGEDLDHFSSEPTPATGVGHGSLFNRFRGSPSLYVCDKCQHTCSAIDDLQVHALTQHHEEPLKDTAESESKEPHEPKEESGENGNGSAPMDFDG